MPSGSGCAHRGPNVDDPAQNEDGRERDVEKSRRRHGRAWSPERTYRDERPEADEDDAQDELEDRAGLHSCRMKWTRKYWDETTGTASGRSSRIHRVGHRPRIAVPARICRVPKAQPVYK